MNDLSGTDILILAGGKGTRLRSVVTDVPKVMASIDNRPFLFYLLDYVKIFGARRVILCTGYKGQMVRQAMGESYRGMSIAYSHEDDPLGTGGALRLALRKAQTEDILVLNGDTMVRADYGDYYHQYLARGAKAALLLVHMEDVSRYGSVQLDQQGRITSFMEKKEFRGRGLINAGAYIFSRNLLERLPLGVSLSLEQDVLPGFLPLPLYGFPQRVPFLDIGTPESLSGAKNFLRPEGHDLPG